MSGIVSAWYQREISVPREWTGRRITLYAEYINSSAAVYLDGAETGTLLFPAGELDITAACRPGEKQVLSLRVTAMPLKAVMLAYTDSNSGRDNTLGAFEPARNSSTRSASTFAMSAGR